MDNHGAQPSAPAQSKIPWLPAEVLTQIFSYLPSSDLAPISQANHTLYTLSLPYIYHTIRLSFPDPRKDPLEGFNYSRPTNRFSRVNQLLRTLLVNEKLAGLIHTIEAERWNVVFKEATVNHTTGCSDEVRKKERRRAGSGEVIRQESELQGSSQGWVNVRQRRRRKERRELGLRPVFESARGEVQILRRAIRKVLDTYPKSKFHGLPMQLVMWEQKILIEGDLDASFALILVAVSQANLHRRSMPNVTRGHGLTVLRLKLDHTIWRKSPIYLWRILALFWGLLAPYWSNAPHTSLVSRLLPNATCGLPFLTTLSISAKRFPHPKSINYYDCDFSQMVTPLFVNPTLLHTKLTTLDLTLLERDNLKYSRAPTSSPYPPLLPTLTSLTLKSAYISSLVSILQSTPSLTHLDYTFLMNLAVREHRFLEYEQVGTGLSHVMHSLETLKLTMFMFGFRHLRHENIESQLKSWASYRPGCIWAGPSGNPMDLRLNEMTSLKELTASLTVLLGPLVPSVEWRGGATPWAGNWRTKPWLTLSDVLPVGLQILRLADEKTSSIEPEFKVYIPRLHRQWDESLISELITPYMRNRSWKLKKLVFLREAKSFVTKGVVDRTDQSFWPGYGVARELKALGEEEGVIVKFGEDVTRREWYEEYSEQGDLKWLRSVNNKIRADGWVWEDGYYEPIMRYRGYWGQTEYFV